MVAIKFIEITKQDSGLIKEFLRLSPESIKSFRYYQKRTIDIIDNHLITVIVMNGEKPVGYGHLDKEKQDVWLGVAVSDGYLGLGIGSKITEYLIAAAKRLQIQELKLTVDLNNKPALKLYERYGFKSVKNYSSKVLLMQRKNA